MGKNKQSKDEAPSPNSVANREIFQRLNFLYQASAYLKAIEVPARQDEHKEGTDSNGNVAKKRKKGAKRRKASLGELGSSYVRCMRTIGNKSVVRMDPNIKRTLCKGCNTILIPGTTASVRVRGMPDKGHKVAYTCLACRTSRTIPAPPVAAPPVPVSLSNPIPSPPPLQRPEALTTPTPSHPSPSQKPSHWGKKRELPMPRPLPLFARPDAGHIVFRGNEMLRESEQ